MIASLLTQARDVPNIRTPSVDWLAVSPEIALAGAAVAIVLLRSLVRRGRWVYPASLVLAFSGVTAAAALLVRQWSEVQDHGAITTIAGMLRVDGFGVFLGGVVVAATALALLLSVSYIERERLEGPEYLALILLSATGMLAMTTANDLVVVFLALEILSIPLYVLAAFDRRRLASQEAGIKYFVLGAFSSAVFLYGVALVYGATGTTSLTGISRFLAANTLLDEGVLLIGLGLLLVGLGFKVAAVPFHMWTPDVYQGAPTPVTAFMSSATKVAGFAALLRVFQVSFPLFRNDWRPAVGALAIASLAVGSIAAVVQNDVKRMLAYSSIAHAGYILIGFAAAAVADGGASARGLQAALFYLLVYAFMTIGAFAVVTIVARSSHDARHTLSEYRGLAAERPALAALLTFFLLAQAGVPFTGGFVAKLQVFAAAVDAREYYLAIAGVIAAVVAAFFYLRVVVTMYSGGDEPAEAAEPRRRQLRVDARGRRARGHRRAHPRARHPSRRVPRPRQGRHVHAALSSGLRHVGAAAEPAAAGTLAGAGPLGLVLVEGAGGQVVGLLDEHHRVGEVEQVALVGRVREHDHVDLGRGVPELEVEPLVAGDREGPHGHVERGTQPPLDEGPRHVAHVDPVDRAGQGVPQRHRVRDRAVDEHAPVVLDGGKQRRQRRAGEQRRLDGAGREHDLLAGGQVGRHDTQGNLGLGERRGGVGPVEDREQALVREQVIVAAEHVPRPGELAALEHLARADRHPDVGEVLDAGDGRVGRDDRPVQRPRGGADDHVGHDPPLDQCPQHADLADGLVAAAGEHERGARSVGRPHAPGRRWNAHGPKPLGASLGRRGGLILVGVKAVSRDHHVCENDGTRPSIPRTTAILRRSRRL